MDKGSSCAGPKHRDIRSLGGGLIIRAYVDHTVRAVIIKIVQLWPS
jgi:hypothetical protein